MKIYSFFINSSRNSLKTSLIGTRRTIILTTQKCYGLKLRWNDSFRRDFVWYFIKINSTLVITVDVIKSPWSILASACRSSDRCAIEKSSSRKPSFTEFRVREARAMSVPPHITIPWSLVAYCQWLSGRFDQYFPESWLVYRFDYSHETDRHSRDCWCEKKEKRSRECSHTWNFVL